MNNIGSNKMSCLSAGQFYKNTMQQCIYVFCGCVFESSWNQAATFLDREVVTQKAASEYDRSADPLQPLADGCQVLVQNPPTKKWDQVWTTICIGRTRSYHVHLPSGHVLWRSRLYLRSLPLPSASSLGQSPSSDNT